MNNINYFGTSLTEAGHYMWELDNTCLRRSRTRYEEAPFDPERLPLPSKDKGRIKGDVQAHHAFGYTIIAIEGSCRDDRPGTKSVFWVEGTIDYEEMKARLLKIPIVQKIINQMPFKVNWIPDRQICDFCDGTGEDESNERICPDCRGEKFRETK